LLLLLLLWFEAETKALRGNRERFLAAAVVDLTKRAAADTIRKDKPPGILGRGAIRSDESTTKRVRVEGELRHFDTSFKWCFEDI
jgi:hypothetical protein